MLDGSAVEHLRLEEDTRIWRGDGGEEESLGLGWGAGYHYYESRDVGEEGLGGLRMIAFVFKCQQRKKGAMMRVTLQSSVSHATAGHPHHQAAGVHIGATGTVTNLRCFVDELIKGRIDIIRELYLGDRFHALGCAADSEAHDALLGERGIEDAFRSKLCGEVHGAAENTSKGHILAKQQDTLISGHSGGQRIIDGLEKVHSFGC